MDRMLEPQETDKYINMALKFLFMKGTAEIKEFNSPEVVRKHMIERDGIRYPHKSWFMSYNSTIEGHVSSRNPAKGSIVIQALCKKLDELWYRADVASIASEVNKEIMENYGQIQAPIYENQLGDKVYFDYLKLSRC